jgi:hypothetical protein
MLAISGDVALGQAVAGRVLDAATRAPVPVALVTLVDGSGSSRGATAADSAGAYRLDVPSPGSYVLRAEALGYERYESPAVAVEAGDGIVSVDLLLRAVPIPIRGVEVSAEQVNRRLRAFLGMAPGLLRVRPIGSATIERHAERGESLGEMVRWLQIPNLQVLSTRQGPCYQHRGRGCMPVYLDGVRLSRSSPYALPLEMMSTVVILLPTETVAWPEGAVHVFTIGFMR